MDKTVIRTEGGFRATIKARHHVWHADLPEDADGTDEMANPEEMVLGALGACMAQTAKIYARHKGFQLEDVEVELTMERFSAADYPDYDGDEPFVFEVQERIVLHGPLTIDEKRRIMGVIKKCPVRRFITLPTIFKETLVEGEQLFID